MIVGLFGGAIGFLIATIYFGYIVGGEYKNGAIHGVLVGIFMGIVVGIIGIFSSCNFIWSCRCCNRFISISMGHIVCNYRSFNKRSEINLNYSNFFSLNFHVYHFFSFINYPSCLAWNKIRLQ
jgi:hypothetical protein